MNPFVYQTMFGPIDDGIMIALTCFILAAFAFAGLCAAINWTMELFKRK